jgi:hypothetical protein
MERMVRFSDILLARVKEVSRTLGLGEVELAGRLSSCLRARQKAANAKGEVKWTCRTAGL